MTLPFLPSRWLITSAEISDDPDVFPLLPGQSFLTQKKPQWSTSRVMSVSGRERRRPLWSAPLWTFRVKYEFLRDNPTQSELRRLVAFFNSKSGGYQSFLYRDPTDFAAVGQPLGTGDGVKTVFQLQRVVSVGTIAFTEPVRALINTPTIYINGVATTAFTVGAFGRVTMAVPPVAGAVVTWDGSFMFLCAFVDDTLDVGQMMNGLWSNSGLSFRSVKR